MPLAMRVAPMTSATASAICATAKMFLSRWVRPEPMEERAPAFSWSTRLMRSASATGAKPEIKPAKPASRKEKARTRLLMLVLDQPDM
jgi:hypothetical protein